MIVTTYQYSGKITLNGCVISVVLGALTACVLGLAYGYMTVWVPFIYVNLLATIGLGAGSGLAAGKGAKMGKLQSPAMYVAIGLLVGLAGEYFNWVWWIFALSRQELLTFNPEYVFRVAREILQKGTWGIGGEAPLAGLPLLCVWIVEGLIIIGAAVAMCLHTLKSSICCSRCETWFDEPHMTCTYARPTVLESVVSNLKTLNFSCLNGLERLTERPFPKTFLNLEIYLCPGCRKFACFSLILVEMVTKGKKTEMKKTRQINRQLLTRETLEELTTCCEASQPVPEPDEE